MIDWQSAYVKIPRTERGAEKPGGVRLAESGFDANNSPGIKISLSSNTLKGLSRRQILHLDYDSGDVITECLAV